MTRSDSWKSRFVLALICAAAAAPASAQTFGTVLSFQQSISAGSTTALAQGTDGNLYGVGGGGKYNQGTIFRVAPNGRLTVIYNFCSQYPSCPDGADPVGLVLGTDGAFYGTAAHGGYNGCEYSCGTLFRITPDGKFTTLYQFGGFDGSNPLGGLAEAPDGSFLGTTVTGGANGGGTVFKTSRQGKLTTIYNFCDRPQCADGYQPTSTLSLGVDGSFYGITSFGGTGENCDGLFYYGCGTAFRITSTGDLTTLYSFCSAGQSCADGYGPYSGLLLATDGDFYGVTQTTAFRLTRFGKLTTLYSFCSKPNCADGSWAQGELIEGTDRNLYGVTVAGGNEACEGDFGAGCGTIFDLARSDAFTTLHSFDGTDGETPLAGLIQATNGTFYGTTPAGGSNGSGTLFRLDMGLGPFVAFVRGYGKIEQRAQVLGQGFEGTSAVSFNGTLATFKVVSDTYLTAMIPQGATTGYVTVTTPTGVLTSNVPFRVIQ